jgi:hypothetical protein
VTIQDDLQKQIDASKEKKRTPMSRKSPAATGQEPLIPSNEYLGNLDRLYEPLPESDIEWRIQQAGITRGKPWARVLAYITARGAMHRLDEVFGPLGWSDSYASGPDGGVICAICVASEGRIITKTDGAPNTDIESVKGGLSDAFKRACVKYGIGRYLYRLGDSWANFLDRGSKSVKIDGVWYKWDPPKLPLWATPKR